MNKQLEHPAQAIQIALARVKTDYYAPLVEAHITVLLPWLGPGAPGPGELIQTALVTLARRNWYDPWYFKSYSSPRGPLPTQTHQLKTDPAYFQEVLIGTKTAELRFNDRGYQEGDLLELQEYCQPERLRDWGREDWVPGSYTGRKLLARVTHLLADFPGLQPGWVMMSIELY